MQNNNRDTWLHHNTASVIAVLTIILSFTIFFVILTLDISDSREKILIYILGVLSAVDTQIISFYFGSSHGSREKDNRIRKSDTIKE